ncbi:hypothetical protein JOF36_007657 [Pseudonocardia parietis]|uniref:Uncharacterized protein n=1 Tax=Pseudonocardia parietis TaxID=570936 RepID=A0ABS4W6Q3_9PSEU|nr:hypothetical protein [Pseudonocardia parietis]
MSMPAALESMLRERTHLREWLGLLTGPTTTTTT